MEQAVAQRGEMARDASVDVFLSGLSQVRVDDFPCTNVQGGRLRELKLRGKSEEQRE